MHKVTTLSVGDLFDCLLQTPPVDLLGLALLRQSAPPSGAWFPVQAPLAQVRQATVQFIAYGNRCLSVAHKLAALRPVPLAVSCVEYGL